MYYYADRNRQVANNPEVQSKLDEISKSELPIAWDGCHKIYMCHSRDDVDMMKDYGYEIHLPNKIHDIWDKSCELKFIHPADLSNGHPLEIHQFEDDPNTSCDYCGEDYPKDELFNGRCEQCDKYYS